VVIGRWTASFGRLIGKSSGCLVHNTTRELDCYLPHHSKRLTFDGILSHSGQAYAVRGRDEVRRVAEHERRLMVDCAERLRRHQVKVRGISIGSTPAMSVVEDLDSCLVVPNFREYLVVRGGEVVDVWPILPGVYAGF